MQTAYVVVPFERVGARVGARQAMISVDAASETASLAQQLAQQVPGVAVIERRLPDTGDGVDKLLAGYGMVPSQFPECTNWVIALN